MSVSTFAVSLALTLLLELPFVYAWGLRSRHNLKLAVLVNVLTNPAVVLLYVLAVMYTELAMVPVVLLLEGTAWITEGLLYKRYARAIRRPWLFAIAANLFSYGMGELIKWMR